MAVITVGQGEDFSTIAAAVAAANPGDTIDVNAGTYNDDFLDFSNNITLQAVGGEVVMTEDQQPPDGKAMITESGNVTINGFDISGVTVDDGNGAAIRYQGGNLSLSQDYFHDNQDGILAAPDPNGTISIDDSEFANNGNGVGNTHNLYINEVANFTITNSYIHDANVGHEIKSRADNTVIENNRILDNNGNDSYSIDLPSGGNATISGNTILQNASVQNPFIIAYAEEGQVNSGTSVSISGNTIVNLDPGATAILNRTGTSLGFTDNSVYGLTDARLSTGPLAESGTSFLSSPPAIDTSSLAFINPPAGGAGGTGGGGSGGGGGTGTGGGTGGGGDNGGGGTVTPPPPPPPAMTLDDYHTLVMTDFTAYAAVHPDVWTNSGALTAIVTEITSTSVLTTPPAGDLWS